MGAFDEQTEPYGSMNSRTTRVSIELRNLQLYRGALLTTSFVLPSREAMQELKRAARFLRLSSLQMALARGWLLDLQSLAIAFIEGPS